MNELSPLSNVRADVRGRTASGLLSAELQLGAFNYVNRYRRPTRGAKGNGIRFEKRVVETLEKTHSNFFSGPAFSFKTIYNPRVVCIPDGLFFLKEEIVVVEIKLRHTVDAWYQLTQLYAPVVGMVFPNRRLRLLEICSSYDPVERFPEPYLTVSDLNSFLRASGPRMGVWIWGR